MAKIYYTADTNWLIGVTDRVKGNRVVLVPASTDHGRANANCRLKETAAPCSTPIRHALAHATPDARERRRAAAHQTAARNDTAPAR